MAMGNQFKLDFNPNLKILEIPERKHYLDYSGEERKTLLREIERRNSENIPLTLDMEHFLELNREIMSSNEETERFSKKKRKY